MNSEYLIQSNPPLLYYLLHIIDRVWVKYCYWEPVNQTIQYYSLNHPRTSLSDYKVFDMRLYSDFWTRQSILGYKGLMKYFEAWERKLMKRTRERYWDLKYVQLWFEVTNIITLWAPAGAKKKTDHSFISKRFKNEKGELDNI